MKLYHQRADGPRWLLELEIAGVVDDVELFGNAPGGCVVPGRTVDGKPILLPGRFGPRAGDFEGVAFSTMVLVRVKAGFGGVWRPSDRSVHILMALPSRKTAKHGCSSMTSSTMDGDISQQRCAFF